MSLSIRAKARFREATDSWVTVGLYLIGLWAATWFSDLDWSTIIGWTVVYVLCDIGWVWWVNRQDAKKAAEPVIPDF